MKTKRSELGTRILIAVITASITAIIPLIFKALQPSEPLYVVLQDLRSQEPEAFDQYIETAIKDQDQSIMEHMDTGILLNGTEIDCYAAEGKTYIALSDLLDASGGALSMDTEGALVFSDTSPVTDPSGPRQNWLEACFPYEQGQFDPILESEGASMQISGISHTDGLLSNTSWRSEVLFNLQGNYKVLTLSAGHIDGSAMVDCTYNFYVDDSCVKTVTLKADALPVTLEIPLDHGQQLKIENLDTVSYTKFGFFDGYFG